MLNSDEAKHKETEAMLNAYFYIAQNFCFVQIENKSYEIKFESLSEAADWAEKNHITLMG